MKWSILILTKANRIEFLDRILAILGPQVAEHYEEVELIVRTYDPKLSLGVSRQLMIDGARGEYVNFVDDDDLIPFYYVKKILPELGKADMVGFRLEQWTDGVWNQHSTHSLKEGGWFNDDKGAHRDLSHLNPIRRELMTKVSFEGARGEDARWAERMRELKIVKTEVFIDDVLYLYLYRQGKEIGEQTEVIK